MSAAPKTRPKYYDLSLAHLPPPGLVSIFHRISGALLFLLIPVFLYVLQGTLASEADFLRYKGLLGRPIVKLVALGLFWLYAHHFFAGLRYLLLDVHVGIGKESARTSANVVLALGVLATVLLGWCVW